MSDLQNLLDQIDRLDQQATKGPWVDEDNALREILYHQRNELGGYAGSASLAEVLTSDADAEFISLSRSALPKLAKMIDGLIEHCHNVMSWETPRGHEERIAVESRKQGARAVYKAITDALEDTGVV